MCIIGRSVNWCSHYGNQYEASSKKKIKIVISYDKKKDYVYLHGCVRCVDTKWGQAWKCVLKAGWVKACEGRAVSRALRTLSSCTEAPAETPPSPREESEAQGEEVTCPCSLAWGPHSEPKLRHHSLLSCLSRKTSVHSKASPLKARHTGCLSLWEAWYRLDAWTLEFMMVWVQISTGSCASCVALGMSLILSVPQLSTHKWE